MVSPSLMITLSLPRRLRPWLISLLAFPLCLAQAEELRLLTWTGYAPTEVVQQFERETGIKVKVTLSNNEDMVERLKVSAGAGYDLVQPSQDRILSTQQQYNLYQPLELDKIELARFQPAMLASTQAMTRMGNEVYGLPHIWGTSGLIVHESVRDLVQDYTDLCAPPVRGRVSFRLKRPILIGMAFALGEDPFAAYSDPARYGAVLKKVGRYLQACRGNLHSYWSSSQNLQQLFETEQILAAEGWDADAWNLQHRNPKIRFVVPKSGALGWIDTFALPRKARNPAAAYRWINFVMRPEIAARITGSSGYFTAARDADQHLDPTLRANLQTFDAQALANIRWYPPVPPGLEALETRQLRQLQTP